MKWLSYEDYCTPEEVEVFRRVKRRQMAAADAARRVVAKYVGGEMSEGGKKHFIHTDRGTFRVAMQDSTDNGTEQRAHGRLGARVVVLGDEQHLVRFLREHGKTDRRALETIKRQVRKQVDKL